jgi:spoIIIJ-associated protein
MQDSQAILDTLREHHDAGVAFTDEEIDAVADIALQVIHDILRPFGEDSVSIDEYLGDDGELIFDISEGDLAILIGRHGKTLDAFQLVVSSMVNYKLGFHYPVVVDIEGYKNRRKSKVQSMARNAAEKVKAHGGSVKLPYMTPYERRLVHLALRNESRIDTHSEGEDPERYVVISLK